MVMDTVTVNIYGENYTLRADDDPDYVREVAHLVDEKMREVAAGGKVVVTSKIAILAALSLADKLLSEKRDRRKNEEVLDRRIEKLLTELQSALAG